jgi:sulfate transport system substrate-binding protein
MKSRVRSIALALAVLACHTTHAAEILNASYDVSRELFDAINPAFAQQWQVKTGERVTIRQSHAGSSKQARTVADGLPADVVTFNQVTDIQLLQRTGVVAADWQKRLPNNASPYYSLPIFLVRSGNPKGIKDWNDLARPGVQVVFPNPKTSGNGRYTYLAAYAYALDANQGDQAKAKAFVAKLLANVPVFDTGGRGATTTFVEREIGDALVTFESEVTAIRKEYGKSNLQAVTPSLSLRADFPVAVVDKVVDKKGTRKVASAYIEFLFSPQGQEIVARHYNRVNDANVAKKYAAQFPQVKLVTVESVFGGWEKVTAEHFKDGGILDQAFKAAPAR